MMERTVRRVRRTTGFAPRLGVPGFLLLASAVAPAPTRAQEAELVECPVPGMQEPGLCGTVTVFEDREAGEGRTIDLAVLVLPATGPDPNPDPIFLLAGGPGQAATGLAPAMSQVMPTGLRESRDIVLVDQRGTGRSNGLQCAIDDVNEILQTLAFELSATRLRACRDGYDADLTLYTTPLAMDDLDDVRKALGYERINLWGGSYGTRAALVYMRRHPERVRAAVLRGVAPTNATLPLYFARDAQRALALLEDACEASESCAASDGDLHENLELLLGKLAGEPARVETINPLTNEPAGAQITAEAFAGGIRLIQYGTPFSRQIPWIVEAGLEGNFEPFLTVTLPFGAQLIRQIHIGMFLSVVCAEDVPYLDLETAEAEAAGTYLGTTAVRYMVLACDEWPRADLPAGYREPVRSDAPVLVVSGNEDPVTPPSWGDLVLEHLPNGFHLVLPRTGHFPSTPGCSEELIGLFLERGSAKDLEPACLEEIERPPFASSPGGSD